MKKIFVLAIVVVVVSAVWITGLYPVAIVGGSPILYRAWDEAKEAAKRFADAESRSAGGKPIDFSRQENAEMLKSIGRDALNYLIEDKIFQQEGERLASDFSLLVRERVGDALKEGKDVENAARLVYGLNLNDFRRVVLTPQAHAEVIQEILLKRNQDFGEWLSQEKKSKSVRLLFVPYQWNGEAVR